MRRYATVRRCAVSRLRLTMAEFNVLQKYCAFLRVEDIELHSYNMP